MTRSTKSICHCNHRCTHHHNQHHQDELPQDKKIKFAYYNIPRGWTLWRLNQICSSYSYSGNVFMVFSFLTQLCKMQNSVWTLSLSLPDTGTLETVLWTSCQKEDEKEKIKRGKQGFYKLSRNSKNKRCLISTSIFISGITCYQT